MRVFVTGATGLIGGAVADALVARGDEVVALARSEETAAAARARGLGVHRGDVADPASLAEGARTCDAVVHTAVGLPRGVTEADGAALDALIGALPGRPVVLTTGLGVYFGLGGALLDEDSALDGALPAQQPRIALEQRAVAGASRARTIVVRPAHVYGRGGAGLFTRLQLDYAAKHGVGGYVGDGTGTYGTVHVDDLAAAYLLALDSGRPGSVYNVVGGSHPMREVAAAVAHAVGAGGRTVALTRDEAVAAWGPMAAALAGTPPVSALRATVELGWTPRHPTFAWELTHGSLRRAR